MNSSENKKNFINTQKIHGYFFGCDMSRVMESFLKDLSVVFVVMMIASVVLFFLNMFGARFLGASEYGKYQLILVVAQFFMIFMMCGFNTAATKYVSESQDRKQKREVTTVAVILTLVSTSLTVLIGLGFKDIIAEILKIDSYMIGQAIVLSGILTFFYLTRSVLQGWKEMRSGAMLEAISAAASFILFFAFVFLNRELLGYQIFYNALLSGYIIFILLSIIVHRNIFRLTRLSLEGSKKIFHYGRYVVLGSFSGILLSSTDKLILNYFYDTDVVGLYSVYLLASIVIFMQIVNIANAVFFPYVSESQYKKQVAQKIKKIMGWIFLVSFVGSIFSVAGILFFIGEAYEMRLLHLVLFALGSAIMVTYQVRMWFLNACGVNGVRITVQGTLIAGIFNFALGCVLIFFYGITGAIISTIIASIFLNVYFAIQMDKDDLYK